VYVFSTLSVIVITVLLGSLYVYYFGVADAADRQALIMLLTLGAAVFAGIWAARQASIANQTLNETLKPVLVIEVIGTPTLVDADPKLPDVRTDVNYVNPTSNTMEDVSIIARLCINQKNVLDISDLIGIRNMQIGPHFRANRHFPLYYQCRAKGLDLEPHLSRGDQITMDLEYRYRLFGRARTHRLSKYWLRENGWHLSQI
jgi:hypothetical protein